MRGEMIQKVGELVPGYKLWKIDEWGGGHFQRKKSPPEILETNIKQEFSCFVGKL